MMISVSYTNSVYDKKTTINRLNEIKDIDYIHLDLMDGEYVEEKNFEINELLDMFKNIAKPKDIHLMVNHPEEYIEKLTSIKPDIITFHPDAKTDPIKTIKLIKSYNIKCGLAINSFIDLDKFKELYDMVDLILIMSVKAGYGGQTFLSKTYDKLDKIENLKDNHHFMVEIDGGINDEYIKKLSKYPIDIFVVGSYICMNENFERPIEKLINE